MTNRQWYQQILREASRLRDKAEDLRMMANRLERDAERHLGMSCVHVEPGFPNWTHKDLPGYFNSADEVLEALEAKRG